ncbi:MAG: reverse transcriptase family protein, partial [gamma proteobacterium symbiont of Bathyaustriella thionipta]|nr:reverse transcriptase family protein [gamma proteobacterium symbiont of Bathyaustriella thionipta]
EKLKGNLIRSRAEYIDKGERPTKYFCGLEKHNYVTKTMQQLQKDDGTFLTEQDTILKETELFYKKLYSSREAELENIDLKEYVGHHMKTITDEQANKLEGILTLEEISDTLKNMKNGKSPGLSGFSAEFFKVFWAQLGIFILRSLNYGYNIGELSITQKQGIITCIPKDNKPKIFLKNWRPLTLLDTVYKLASGAIANRIKTVLDLIINKDQTGFIKGRSIVENIRVIYDIMKFTDEQHIPGLLLLIDFEKAFDSLSWHFLYKALEHLNFGESIRKWVKVFYTNITSAVILSGHLSSFFNIERGCRQGDPLSPYLFVICAEFLATKIRKNKKIKGIHINNIEFKISQYADDTSAILDGTETSLNQTLEEILTFSRISGLNINLDKTQLVWIGSEKFSTRSIKTKWKLLWGNTKFKLLGIHFNSDLEKMIKDNYTPKMIQMEKVLKQWNKRSLSPIGKITVIKTLIIPIFNLLFIALPNPDAVTSEKINKTLYDFLWNKNPKIKKAVLVKQYTEGGLNMTNVNALKSTWIRRLLLRENKWQEYIMLHMNLEKLVSCNVEYTLDIFNTLNNQFWKDVLQACL